MEHAFLIAVPTDVSVQMGSEDETVKMSAQAILVKMVHHALTVITGSTAVVLLGFLGTNVTQVSTF